MMFVILILQLDEQIHVQQSRICWIPLLLNILGDFRVVSYSRQHKCTRTCQRAPVTRWFPEDNGNLARAQSARLVAVTGPTANSLDLFTICSQFKVAGEYTTCFSCTVSKRVRVLPWAGSSSARLMLGISSTCGIQIEEPGHVNRSADLRI